MFSQENIKIEKPVRKIKSSESIASISKALSQLQLEVTNPLNSKTNPFFHSKYAPLSEVLNVVRPLLGKNGLAIIQNPYSENDKVYITTLITHASGEWIESDPLILKPEKDTPQGIGSAITYGRRYILSSILGISSEEDDDGNTDEPKKDKPSKGKKEEPPTPEVSEATQEQIAELETKKAEFDTVKKDIITMAKAKAAINTDIKSNIKTILIKYHVSGNPNKIVDVEKAKECLAEIKNIKTEEIV